MKKLFELFGLAYAIVVLIWMVPVITLAYIAKVASLPFGRGPWMGFNEGCKRLEVYASIE